MVEKERKERGEDGGEYDSCTMGYNTSDREQWGYPEPCPCPAFGLRMSRAEQSQGEMIKEESSFRMGHQTRNFHPTTTRDNTVYFSGTRIVN
jgi:hypothetical protein